MTSRGDLSHHSTELQRSYEVNDTSGISQHYVGSPTKEVSLQNRCGPGDSVNVIKEPNNNHAGAFGDFQWNGLDNTLINRGSDGSLDNFVSASKILQGDDGYNVGTPSIDDHQFQFAPSLAINNTPNFSQSQPLRKYSGLRNVFNPDTDFDFSTMMAAPLPQQFHSSSPSRYTLRPQSGLQTGSTSSQILQPFQESNVRDPPQQLPGYNSLHHLAHLQQLPFPHHSEFSQHHPGLLPYPAFPYQPMPQQALRHQGLAMAPPSTPPNLCTHHEAQSDAKSTFEDSSSDVIKRESSSANSPTIPVKRSIRKGRKRAVFQSSEVVDVDHDSTSKKDEEYLEDIVDAMKDTSQAEDNVGMKATWDKILISKAEKIRPKSIEMLQLLKRAEHEQLGDKKSANVYLGLDHRVRETCNTLRTQKTVSKHLMEAPYSYTVANDPIYAASRVRNNRRVNGQKRTAITVGRRAMGLQKGKGKGHKIQKLDKDAIDVVEDDLDDVLQEDENSGDDDVFEIDSEYTPVKLEPTIARRSTRHSSKRIQYNEDEYSPIPKKKRKRRCGSKYQMAENGHSTETPQRSRAGSEDQAINNGIDTFRPSSRAHENHSMRSPPNYLPGLNSSPYQHHEPAYLQENSHVYGHHPFGSIASLPPLHFDHNGGFHLQNMPRFGQNRHQHYTAYTEPDQDFLERYKEQNNGTGESFEIEQGNFPSF